MSITPAVADAAMPRILETVRRYWGFDRLRPLQEQAIRAGLELRDSLVVLPTGGGKSLCYQVPAALAGRTDVVVSPLIALMKDQVDGLRECGYPAAALHSNLPADELRDVEARFLHGEYRLVFVAPERLVAPRFLELMQVVGVRAFAIDEAHCISHWGHDFRPEYRQLAILRERFPQVSIHAYTATATPRVRQDIMAQLRLRDPRVLIGDFDRPNLVYRIVPRTDAHGQTLAILRRHGGQAVIVYCLSRRETEELAAYLRSAGLRAAHYHAGMTAELRRRTQDEFAEEKIDVVCATVAFGMGIDRSDVRCVVHTTMPKSAEHYQQETGRAGRDGLEAECVLLYSSGDVIRWRSIIERTAESAADAPAVMATMKRLLDEMQSIAAGMTCRHKALAEYFGQRYERSNCGACDVCLDEMEPAPDSTMLAQKILSCVARVQERFATRHVVEVLVGADTERIRQWRHHQLSTYGLLRDEDRKVLTSYVNQLVDQKLLARGDGSQYYQLMLNAASWEVMRGRRQVRLLRPRAEGVKQTHVEEQAWAGVDRGLFDQLRAWRRDVALERRMPAYLILGDATLRELARVRPPTQAGLRRIRGIGDQKAVEWGEQLVQLIGSYCREHGLPTNQEATPKPPAAGAPPRRGGSAAAAALFAQGASIDDVMRQIGRARGTVVGYLAAFIRERRPERIDRWVSPETYAKVARAVEELTGGVVEEQMRLTPIFEYLGGQTPHHDIRLVLAHLSVRV